MSEAFLVMFRDGGPRRPFRLSKDVVVIGRREDCDLRIALSDVSRKHCRLLLNDGGIAVEDLGSSNGTFVNGHRVQSVALEAGDTLQVGPVVFVLQVDGEPPTAEMHPIAHQPRRDANSPGGLSGPDGVMAESLDGLTILDPSANTQA